MEKQKTAKLSLQMRFLLILADYGIRIQIKSLIRIDLEEI